MSSPERKAESAVERTLSVLEDYVHMMPDEDIEFLDELGREVIAGRTVVTRRERSRLRRMKKDFVE